MATTVRVTTLTLGTAGALVASTTSAEVFPTMASAKEQAEALYGPIRWRPSESTRSSWAIGTPSARPSAYDQRIVVAPAAKGVAEVVEELRRLDAPNLDDIRQRVLSRQRPAPAQPTEETPA
ncbi:MULTISPECIES: hypothetical protein [unclassified Gordonia (in: high G+C Gram-positive bacteria)]|uniref:hypothetical protein n=1 Tax=unclassified Gordonia (in: high G+C Gram-positive bacteria) TaxID=2657482 RepID=UPI000839E222|nr:MULTISPECIES: hypothetical protein [unclassified Gordonia (in: high G+C Gram-positive bacteria)]MBN0971512.1 hypothetical protein [Gordonia sp. BP-119]MBN0981354.1 hypothetical protein [Gordonia sp. BP-94]OCW85640.1 hypothetical protein A8M60_04885 [Nocardia farcinica]WGJ84188.1 hypothetical protein QAD21_15485 [Gordonia sp. SMJS1]